MHLLLLHILGKIMMLLCSGSDMEKLEGTKKELLRLGIACELRAEALVDCHPEIPNYPELWIRAEQDFSRAVHVFSRLASVHKS